MPFIMFDMAIWRSDDEVASVMEALSAAMHDAAAIWSLEGAIAGATHIRIEETNPGSSELSMAISLVVRSTPRSPCFKETCRNVLLDSLAAACSTRRQHVTIAFSDDYASGTSFRYSTAGGDELDDEVQASLDEIGQLLRFG
jgi:hypothetical protein